MSTFTITVQDAPVRAVLQALERRMGDLRPVFQAIGEGMVERSKRRFETSTAPDNTPWAPYPVGGATLSMLATRLAGSKSNRKKSGALNAKGTRLLSSKKLLIGESQDLRRQIVPRASSHQLVVSATPVYAAMQQFGGTTGSGSMICSIRLAHSCLNRNKADFLLHRGGFRLTLTHKVRAILCTD